MAKILADDDFIVYLIDLRGYGLSGGGRAQGSLTEFFSDVQKGLEQMDNELPIFLLGHSMGAGRLRFPQEF